MVIIYHFKGRYTLNNFVLNPCKNYESCWDFLDLVACGNIFDLLGEDCLCIDISVIIHNSIFHFNVSIISHICFAYQS